MAIMQKKGAFCDQCRQVNLDELKGSHGYVHHSTFQALRNSSSICGLCKLIVEACHNLAQTQGFVITAELLLLGPVRLFASSQTDADSGHGWRDLEAVKERRLSSILVVNIGNLKHRLSTTPDRSVLLEMYAKQGSPAERAGVAQSGDIESHAACDVNFTRLAKWLQHCKRHHPICSLNNIRKLTGSSSMPKRLIDLGQQSDSLATPKLIHARGRQEEYVALSYCWGTQSQLCTTSKNIKEMECRIDVHLLPRTIRDALSVAQKLAVRYVWIDALCIVQDDDEDWATEAKRMGLIYSNAYFTIAATSAESSCDGFLKPRVPNVSIPFHLSSLLEPQGDLYFRNYTEFLQDYHNYITQSPLLKRAWVLQETLLSRRTVHFSSRQIYLECRSTVFAEDGITNDAMDREAAHAFLNTLSVVAGGDGVTRLAEMFFRVWQMVLERYTTLEITRSSDRLPALLGLASLAERILGHQYLYGIWNFNLAYGLFWQAANRPMLPVQEWRAPSWSWAAWEGGIIFEKYFPENESKIRLAEFLDADPLRGALKIRGRVHPWHVSLDLRPQPKPCRSDRKLREIPVTPPEYAFAKDEPTLLAHLACKDYERPSLSEPTSGVPISLLRITEGRLMTAQSPGERNICRFDGERGTDVDLFFLVLACSEHHEFHHCRGLLLRRLSDTPERYQRVGTGWATDEVWHTCPESIITLV